MDALDPRLWNLGTTSLAATTLGITVAACGPAVPVAGDTDGSSASASESETDTVIQPSESGEETGPPPGCVDDVDCSPGFYCAGGECIEDYECSYDDYGCYCAYGHCSPPYYYDCYEDEECGSGSLCEDRYCDTVQNLPECDDDLALQGAPLPIPVDDPPASLAFVDLDPDVPGEQLVVGSIGGGWLFDAEQPPSPLPADEPITDTVATDLDDDGAIDLVLASTSALTVAWGFGTASEALQILEIPQGPLELEVAQNPGALPELVVRTATGLVLVPGSTARTIDPLPFPIPDLAATDLAGYRGADGALGVLLENPNAEALRYLGGDVDSLGTRGRTLDRRVHGGQLDGQGPTEAIWTTTFSDWTFLEYGLDAGDQARAIYFTYPHFAVGDLDGDGLDDVAGMGGGGAVVMRGDEDWGMTCFTQAPLGEDVLQTAAGDFDADGSDELVVLPTAGPAIIYDVSWTP